MFFFFNEVSIWWQLPCVFTWLPCVVGLYCHLLEVGEPVAKVSSLANLFGVGKCVTEEILITYFAEEVVGQLVLYLSSSPKQGSLRLVKILAVLTGVVILHMART